jgi:hypothetical protein
VNVSILIALGALVVSVVSVIFAGVGALRARDALRLQRRIDARAREFREVSWEGTFDRIAPGADDWKFRVTNTGLTWAEGVTLVVEFEPAEKFDLGAIEPGESRSVEVGGGGAWQAANGNHLPVRPGFRIYWSSPEGHPDNAHHPVIQIFI